MKSKDIFTFRDAEKQAGPVAFSTMLITACRPPYCTALSR